MAVLTQCIADEMLLAAQILPKNIPHNAWPARRMHARLPVPFLKKQKSSEDVVYNAVDGQAVVQVSSFDTVFRAVVVSRLGPTCHPFARYVVPPGERKRLISYPCTALDSTPLLPRPLAPPSPYVGAPRPRSFPSRAGSCSAGRMNRPFWGRCCQTSA